MENTSNQEPQLKRVLDTYRGLLHEQDEVIRLIQERVVTLHDLRPRDGQAIAGSLPPDPIGYIEELQECNTKLFGDVEYLKDILKQLSQLV